MKKYLKFILMGLFFCGVLLNLVVNINAEEVEVIKVGLGSSYPPFCYLNEDEKLAGYDFEVLSLIDEKLEQYEFEFEAYPWESIFTALTSNKARIISHQIETNEEREKTYLPAKESYTTYSNYIATWKERDDFNPQTLDDLAGRVLITINGDAVIPLINKYNEENEKQIEMKFVDQNYDVIMTELETGGSDAKLFTDFDEKTQEKTFGDVLKLSDEPVYATETYFFYQLGDEELQKAVDEALKELKEEGKIEELYDKYILNY